MSRPSGTVFAYPYLWNDDRSKGRTDSKDRTTCLAIRRDVAGVEGAIVSHLMLLAITDKVWDGQRGLRIPDIEKRRAGLDVQRPAFVVVSEYNYDVLPTSWHYAPGSRTYGTFGPSFCEEIASALKSVLTAGRLRKVDRTSAERPS